MTRSMSPKLAALALRALAAMPICIVASASLAPIAVLAQQASGTVTGKVLNKNTGQYLKSAVVQVVGTNLTEVTGPGGSFTLLNVPLGNQKLLISYAGLDPLETSVDVSEGEPVEREYALTSRDYADDKEVVTLGAFVVASEREGNAKAVNEQKNSLDMKAVIASDAFGDVSEGNVGEFLKLMPGVSIDYVEADVRSVSIGGMDPKYTTVLIDGQPVSSTNSSGTGRAFDFEQLSIASIETVELSKTPTPDVDGSAMAGVVNLRSKGAFDRKGRQIRYSASGSLNSYDMTLGKSQGWDNNEHRKMSPNFFLEYSDTFLDNKLGVIAGYNYSFTFSEQKAQSFTYDWDHGVDGTPVVTAITYRDSPKPTIRKNYNIRVDYKLSKDLQLYARLDYNTYNARFFSRDLSFSFPYASAVTDGSQEFSLYSQTNTASSITINQGGGASSKHGYTTTPNFGLSYKKGAFRADLQAQYSLATNWYGDVGDGFFWATQTKALTGVNMTWSRSDPNSSAITFTQNSGDDWKSLSSYPTGFYLLRTYRMSKDQNYSAKGDFRYSFQKYRVPTVLKWGVSTKEHSRYTPYNFNTGSTGITYLGPDGVAGTDDDKISSFAETSYSPDFGMGGNVNGVANIDRWALASLYQEHPEYFSSPSDLTLYQKMLSSKRLIREQIDAVYLQSIFKIAPSFDIAPGVRVERTRGYILGPSDIGAAAMKALGYTDTTTADYINTRYASQENHLDAYNTALKYLHANYKLTNNLLLKASYNESITRPDMGVLSSGITAISTTATDDYNGRLTVGNPDLKPEQASNLYISLEYYPQIGGAFTVSVARRDIKNLISYTTTTDEDEVQAWADANDIDLDANGWTGYALRQYHNVSKAHNQSLEVSYQSPQLKFLPGPLRGLSLFANGTAISYDNQKNFYRPNYLGNVGLAYRWRNFACGWRVNWSGRSYTDTTNVYNAPRALQDVNAEYALRRGLSLFMTGRNIWNESTTETYNTRRGVTQRRIYTGAIWNFGIKGTF